MNKTLLRAAFWPLTFINRIIKKENCIFFYSNLGFRDNVKAFYDYLIRNHYNKTYKIIVSVNDRELYESKAPENVMFVGNKEGIRYFLRSEYAFYCFGKYPIKPAPSQTVVNLWHGMPLKRIGNMERGLEKTDYHFFTHIISAAPVFNPVLSQSFRCPPDQVVVTGQPRNDELFIKAPNTDRAVRRGARKLIVWLPTYREDETERLLPGVETGQYTGLNSILREENCRLIVKIHPLQLHSASLPKFSNIEWITQEMLDKGRMSVYALLRASDALITDYSSVAFDYMLLDRPIAYAVPDFETYRQERGFSFEHPLDYMPGMRIDGTEDFKRFLSDLINGNDEYKSEREKVRDLTNTYQDGGSAERIAKRFLP